MRRPRARSLAESAALVSPKPQGGVLHFPWEPIDEHGVVLVVDDVAYLTDHSRQAGFGKPALEDRELHSLSVLLANVRDASKARSPGSFRIVDVVRHEDIHRSQGMTKSGYDGRSPRKWRARNVACTIRARTGSRRLRQAYLAGATSPLGAVRSSLWPPGDCAGRSLLHRCWRLPRRGMPIGNVNQAMAELVGAAVPTTVAAMGRQRAAQPLNKGRNLTPATTRPNRPKGNASASLNKGRSVTPATTHVVDVVAEQVGVRSTKAGV